MKAFPSTIKERIIAGKFGTIGIKETQQDGMNLRDYFAAAALQGILACDYSVDQEPAVLAYQYADEMMKARAHGIGE